MYAKIFNQVLMSSLTQSQPIENRGVFFMLLAAADKKGYIIGTDSSIARVINVPIEIFSRALSALMAPDPESQSKEEDGRRVIRLDESPGLLIVNYEKYSGIGSDEQRREYFRVKKAESRAKQKAAETTSPPTTPPNPPVEIPIPDSLKSSARFMELWELWNEHLIEKRKKPTSRAVTMQLKKLSEWGVERAIAALKNSIAQSYTGIYEPNGTPKVTGPEPNQIQEVIDVPTLNL